MSIHNIGIHGDLTKITFQLPSITYPIIILLHSLVNKINSDSAKYTLIPLKFSQALKTFKTSW